MRFQPKTEKELVEMNLLPKGEYAFDVLDCEERTSKKGSQMLVLSLKLYDAGLQPRGRVSDYLVESMPQKLRRAAYGCGLGAQYEQGCLEPQMFRGATGVARIGIQQDKTGTYPDKNVVMDYVLEKKNPSPAQKSDSKSFDAFGTPQFSEDDIPF